MTNVSTVNDDLCKALGIDIERKDGWVCSEVVLRMTGSIWPSVVVTWECLNVSGEVVKRVQNLKLVPVDG